MKTKPFLKHCCIALSALLVAGSAASLPLLLKKPSPQASALTLDIEDINDYADSLRYGYNVAGGSPLLGGNQVKKSAPILDKLENGLYKYVLRSDTNLPPTSAGNFVSTSAIGIAGQSGRVLSGTDKAKFPIFVVTASMNISTSFKTESGFENIYEERYETYYQRIPRVEYLLQDSSIDLRDYLDSAFERDLCGVTGISSAKTLLDKYGTHLYTGYLYGGMMEFTNYQASDSYHVRLERSSSLQAKIDASVGAMAGGGSDYSFDENYTNEENSAHTYSGYDFKQYGGEAVSAMTMDQLFTYKDSQLDGGKAGYIYGDWVKSVNEEKQLAIIGMAGDGRMIPIWDLLPDGGSYNMVRNCIVQAYKEICGDKYADFCEMYPTKDRVVAEEEKNGAADILGYSLNYNGLTSFYEDDKESTLYEVGKKATINMKISDEADKTIPIDQKEWRVMSESETGMVTVVDDKKGVFRISDTAVNGSTFMLGLFSGDNCLDSRPFTVRTELFFSGGNGSEANPYLIANLTDLQALCRETSYWGKYFRLVANLDCAGAALSGVGREDNRFKGSFDGNHCTISNFKVTAARGDALGLFAYNSGTIKNLTVKGVLVGSAGNDTSQAIKYVGGLAGYNEGTIKNCKVEDVTVQVQYNVNTESDFTISAGGLVGYNQGVVEECCVDNSTTAGYFKAEKYYRNILCYAKDDTSTKNVTASSGGLIGTSASGESVKNCYVKQMAMVWAQGKGRNVNVYAGGFVGNVAAKVTFENCIVGVINELKAAGSHDGNNGAAVYEKYTFAGNKGEAAFTDCYTKENASYSTTSGCTALSDMGQASLTQTLWTKDSSGFPVLKSHVFDANTALSLNTTNAKTDFYYGEVFDISGVALKGRYKDANDAFDVYEFTNDESGYNAKTLGTHRITVSAMGYTKTYNVTVSKIDVIGLQVTPLKEEFRVGNVPNLADYEVVYVLENGDTINPLKVEEYENYEYVNYPTSNPQKDITISTSELLQGDNAVTVTCGEFTETVIVKAVENKLENLEIIQKPVKSNYKAGEKLDVEGLVVQVTYDDGTVKQVPLKELEIIGDRIAEGENEIYVSYGDYTMARKFTVFGSPNPNAGNSGNNDDSSNNDSDSSNNGSTNNGSTNNDSSNNGSTNNGSTNNDSTNNDSSNNGSTNNGSTNNGSTNNDSTNNGAVNNSSNDGGCGSSLTAGGGITAVTLMGVVATVLLRKKKED